MIIDCISDLHGCYPSLEGGDLLLIAGDLTDQSTPLELLKFLLWLDKQRYRQKIFIAGNHDNFIEKMGCHHETLPENTKYLCDSGVEFNGLKIWGSPWTKMFNRQNPRCKAFALDTELELRYKFNLIPSDTDILVTHSPPRGILDTVACDSVGSSSLLNIVSSRNRLLRLKLHVFGHIHDCGSKTLEIGSTKFINCSIVDQHYNCVNNPVRVIL